jgi:AraC-like DNA-binding protein
VLTQDYLNLKLIRLKAFEKWKRDPEAVSFVMPHAGLGHYGHNAVKQQLSPGDVFVSGNSSANLCSAAGTQFAFWGFLIHVDHLFPLFGTSEISLLQVFVDSLKSQYRLYAEGSALAQECYRLIADVPEQSDLEHRGQLLQLACLIFNEEFKAAKKERRTGFGPFEHHIAKAFENLSTEEMLNLSVSELANRFSCSRRNLTRLFHQYFGLSVAGLKMEMRMLKAASLLRDSDAKVINVARQCGFNHRGLFTTCFRRRFATNPGQWQQNANNAQTTNEIVTQVDLESPW